VDKNVDAVTNKMTRRAEIGLRKYGVTTERTDLTQKQWLIHAQEEAMDLAIYLQRLINEADND
jgi:hypothetical protein